MATGHDDAPVLARRQGQLGHLTLNRPRRINALDLEMIELVRAALDDWSRDDRVAVVLIDGAGERGLCAGGDIRSLYEGIRGTDLPPGRFWATEYQMNATIADFPKPVVTFMDGIVFGGGVGIAAHAGVRVVTERSQVAMPETAIGLCPDVGALYLLSRAPGELGTHMALTGARIDGPTAIHAGLADHFLASAALPGLAEELRSGELPTFASAAPAGHDSWIDRCYARPGVPDIIRALRAASEPEAHVAADTLTRMSPTSLKVTLTAIRRAADMSLGQVLEQDLRVSTHFLGHPDLAEGIRAQIIDKDRNPRWRPGTLDEVSAGDVDAFFAPLA